VIAVDCLASRYDGAMKSRPSLHRALTVCALASLVSLACGHDALTVRVSALRDPSLRGRTYWLVPGKGGADPNHLEYRAFAALADRALRARGYQPVDRATEPHLVIHFDYGVGPPASATVSVNTFWNSAVVKTAFTVWVRLSAVEGKAAAGATSAREVWTTTAMTDAPGGNLQNLVPVLLATAMDFFGAAAPERRFVVRLRSQRVAWLTGVAR